MKTVIELDDGKYTYVFDGGNQYALRHGEEWRDLTGDKFVYCMGAEIETLRAQLKVAQDELEAVKDERDALDDTKYEPWPEWSESCLKIVRKKSGYDGYDDAEGVSLPDELTNLLDDYDSEVARLQKQLAAYKQDAERYQFLKRDAKGRWLRFIDQEITRQETSGFILDAAIDAAMKGE